MTRQKKSRPPVKLPQLLRYGGFVVVVACFILYFNRQPERIPDFSKIRWTYFSWVIALSGLANIAAGIGYYTLAKLYDPSLKCFQTVRIFILGRTLNLISPQGGTVFAALSLKSNYSFSYTKYTATMTASLWLDITLASAVALLVLAISPDFNNKQLLAIIFSGAICASLLVALIAITTRYTKKEFTQNTLPRKGAAKIIELGEMLSQLPTAPKTCASYSLLSIGNTLIHGTRLWLCFAMLGQSILWPHAFATTVVVKASNTVSITPGNFGIVEGIIGLMAGQVGISVALAVFAGIAYRFASYAALIILSLLLYFWKTDESHNTPS